MAATTRWDYLNRDRFPCAHCGDYFISEVLPDKHAYICASCYDELVDEPWDHGKLYRALRNDEDPRNGLQPADGAADATVTDHVEFGSSIETQFISTTGRLSVAVFFAARGFHERGVVPRIGVFGVSIERTEKFCAKDMVQGFTAQNFARVFDEYIFEQDEAEMHLNLQYIICIQPYQLMEFEGNTFHFQDFFTQYNGSGLRERLTQVFIKKALDAELDIVGLQYYRNERPEQINEVRLEYDDSNRFDRGNAVKISALSRQGNWVCVGYLSQEHAGVTRAILKESGGKYAVVSIPDFNHVYETRVKLSFIVETSEIKWLINRVLDVCGKAWTGVRECTTILNPSVARA